MVKELPGARTLGVPPDEHPNHEQDHGDDNDGIMT